MPTLADMLHPRCPHHRNMLAGDHGVCCVCEMTTHKHLSGFKLIPDPPVNVWEPRVAYRSEANCYGQDGVIDDD